MDSDPGAKNAMDWISSHLSKWRLYHGMLKGLGSHKNNSSVKYTFRKFRPDIIMLQETKKSQKLIGNVSLFWGNRNMKWISAQQMDWLDAWLSGWISWDVRSAGNRIWYLLPFGEIKNRKKGKKWWLSCIYDPSAHSGNQIELNELGNLIWQTMVCGWWFKILFSTYQKGSSRTNSQSKISTMALWFSLSDLSLLKISHTWSNYRVTSSFSKIDRFFLSMEWLEDHPKACIKGLPTLVSGHCPVMIWSAYLEALHQFNLRISGWNTSLSNNPSNLGGPMQTEGWAVKDSSKSSRKRASLSTLRYFWKYKSTERNITQTNSSTWLKGIRKWPQGRGSFAPQYKRARYFFLRKN